MATRPLSPPIYIFRPSYPLGQLLSLDEIALQEPPVSAPLDLDTPSFFPLRPICRPTQPYPLSASPSLDPAASSLESRDSLRAKLLVPIETPFSVANTPPWLLPQVHHLTPHIPAPRQVIATPLTPATPREGPCPLGLQYF